MMMSKKNIIMVVVVLLVLVGFGLWVKKGKMNSTGEYSVVYLTTGEVYIGHLTTFPDMELRDSYVLQLNKDAVDPSKNSFQINPISEALWAPKVLHLVQKNVVFYGPILPTSKIAQTLLAAQKK